MIYIASALISLFITASLIIAALYLKSLYYKALDDANRFIEMVVNVMNENSIFKE